MKLRLLAPSIACALAVSTMVPAHAACNAGQFDSSFGPASSAGYVQVSPWVSLSSSTGFESLVFGGDNNVYVTGAFAVDSVSNYPYLGFMRTARGGAIDRTYGGMGVAIAGGQAAPAVSSGPNADIAIRSISWASRSRPMEASSWERRPTTRQPRTSTSPSS